MDFLGRILQRRQLKVLTSLPGCKKECRECRFFVPIQTETGSSRVYFALLNKEMSGGHCPKAGAHIPAERMACAFFREHNKGVTVNG